MQKSLVKNFLYVIVFCCVYAASLKFMFSKYYAEATILNGIIGYFLLFLYFIFFNKFKNNIFLFILSNFMNIFSVIIVFLLVTELLLPDYISEPMYWFSLFSIVVLFPFLINGAVVEFLFYKNNRQFSEKINNILSNRIFRYLIILNICSLYFYIQLLSIISFAKGLDF